MVESALQGFNGTVFAYGSTGSGKTFTITGGMQRYEDRGLVPRAISHAFHCMAAHPDHAYQVQMDGDGSAGRRLGTRRRPINWDTYRLRILMQLMRYGR